MEEDRGRTDFLSSPYSSLSDSLIVSAFSLHFLFLCLFDCTALQHLSSPSSPSSFLPISFLVLSTVTSAPLSGGSSNECLMRIQ